MERSFHSPSSCFSLSFLVPHEIFLILFQFTTCLSVFFCSIGVRGFPRTRMIKKVPVRANVEGDLFSVGAFLPSFFLFFFLLFFLSLTLNRAVKSKIVVGCLFFHSGLPIGTFSTKLMTSAPCPEIASGAGSMEVPTQERKCNMPAMKACLMRKSGASIRAKNSNVIRSFCASLKDDAVATVRRRGVHSFCEHGTRPRFLPR